MKPTKEELNSELARLFKEMSPKSNRLRRVVNYYDKEEIISHACFHCSKRIANDDINSITHLRSLFFLRIFYDGVDSRPKYMANAEKFDSDYDLENIATQDSNIDKDRLREVLTLLPTDLATRLDTYVKNGFKVTEMAKKAKVHKSTISRQITKDIQLTEKLLNQQIINELK